MGRVFSVLAMMSSVMMPLGMVLWGPLADVMAIEWMLVGTGVFLFLTGFVFTFDKTMLQAGRQSDPEVNRHFDAQPQSGDAGA